MPYPVVSRAEARTFLLGRRENPEMARPEPRTIDLGVEEDWDAVASEIVDAITTIAEPAPGSDQAVDGRSFEVAAGPEVHRRLLPHPALADPEFWTWFAIWHGLEIIEHRYGEEPDLKNFGIGAAGENFIYRLWLRAEIAHDPTREDEYELAKTGDIDFWRSHIFRQGYANCRAFAHALIEFQFPAEIGRKPYLNIPQIRELVKYLKRARTNLMFEVMDEARAKTFIESEWARVAASS